MAADKLASLRGVFDLAHVIETDIDDRLQAITPAVAGALKRVSTDATAFVTRIGQETDHYFRAQIVENAKNHIGYFADTNKYRSWVALNMRSSRRGQLVFAIHGIGKPFNGSLICALLIEFKDTDEEGQIRTALVPVSDEGFVFFYNENEERLLSRFRPWRENVLKVALKEVTQNL